MNGRRGEAVDTDVPGELQKPPPAPHRNVKKAAAGSAAASQSEPALDRQFPVRDRRAHGQHMARLDREAGTGGLETDNP